jgi:hypothetical protein
MPATNGGGLRAAKEALAEAKDARLQVSMQAAEAQPHIETLRRINEENHFAAWAWRVFERGGPS